MALIERTTLTRTITQSFLAPAESIFRIPKNFFQDGPRTSLSGFPRQKSKTYFGAVVQFHFSSGARHPLSISHVPDDHPFTSYPSPATFSPLPTIDDASRQFSLYPLDNPNKSVCSNSQQSPFTNAPNHTSKPKSAYRQQRQHN